MVTDDGDDEPLLPLELSPSLQAQIHQVLSLTRHIFHIHRDQAEMQSGDKSRTDVPPLQGDLSSSTVVGVLVD